MAKSSFSMPQMPKQQSIPKPAAPEAFSAPRAIGMTGLEKPRGVFRPLAKNPAPPPSHWSGK